MFRFSFRFCSPHGLSPHYSARVAFFIFEVERIAMCTPICTVFLNVLHSNTFGLNKSCIFQAKRRKLCSTSWPQHFLSFSARLFSPSCSSLIHVRKSTRAFCSEHRRQKQERERERAREIEHPRVDALHFTKSVPLRITCICMKRHF